MRLVLVFLSFVLVAWAVMVYPQAATERVERLEQKVDRQQTDFRDHIEKDNEAKVRLENRLTRLETTVETANKLLIGIALSITLQLVVAVVSFIRKRNSSGRPQATGRVPTSEGG